MSGAVATQVTREGGATCVRNAVGSTGFATAGSGRACGLTLAFSVSCPDSDLTLEALAGLAAGGCSAEGTVLSLTSRDRLKWAASTRFFELPELRDVSRPISAADVAEAGMFWILGFFFFALTSGSCMTLTSTAQSAPGASDFCSS